MTTTTPRTLSESTSMSRGELVAEAYRLMDEIQRLEQILHDNQEAGQD